MRLVLELDNKYLALEIHDIEREDDEDDEPVTVEEDQMVRLPFGFHSGPNGTAGGTEYDDDGTEEDEEREAASEVECR